jgi:hypothetical protein
MPLLTRVNRINAPHRLIGTPIGHDAALAVGSCAVIGGVGNHWAMRLHHRDPAHRVRLLSAGHA